MLNRPISHLPRGIAMLGVLACFVLLTSCRSVDPTWPQFHADGPNQGFVLERSGIALQPKWSTVVNPVVHASPVIGPDGTIYLVFAQGSALVGGFYPDGSVRCKAGFNSGDAVLSSAAVDPDGRLYVITITRLGALFSSTLYSLDADCRVLWSYTFPRPNEILHGFTTGSPKIWAHDGEVTIFAVARHTKPCDSELLCEDEDGLNEIFVFRQDGTLLTRRPVGGCLSVSGGGGGGSSPPPGSITETWDTLRTTSIDAIVSTSPGTLLYERLSWLHPTVAVVDYANLDSQDQPLIVVADRCRGMKLTAFRWQAPELVILWQRKDESDVLQYSSPAVFRNGLLVLGSLNGKVHAFDPLSGDTLWTYDAGEPVMGSPASFGRQVFVSSLRKLHLLEFNGDLLSSVSLSGQTLASPALSADFGYLAATEGLYTFSFDLATVSLDGGQIAGFSSAAIGPDGTVYVVVHDGDEYWLRAYPGR